jgi:hypothetical protein
MAVLGSTSLTGCNSIPDFIAGGSLVIFQQTSAPTSWTKQTTHNNKALRVVTGTATPGGSTAFTTVFTSRTPTGSVSVSGGTVNNTTLTTPQIPSHTHGGGVTAPGERSIHGLGPSSPSSTPSSSYTAPGIIYLTPSNTGSTGGDGAHSHPFTVGSASFTGAALDFAVQYVDVIICSKN